MNYLQKALRSLKTCLLANSLCGKLFSPLESPIKFDERLKVTFRYKVTVRFHVPFFISDFNLLSCE